MRRRLVLRVAPLAALSAVAICRGESPQRGGEPGSEPEHRSRSAELYVFNDSGRTLVASDQVVTDNGRKLVSLPRQTYARLEIAPGPHLLKPDPALWKQQVSIDAVPGRRYFVVVAYKPERSWATPLAGAPLVLKEITEDDAAPLLREMKERGRP